MANRDRIVIGASAGGVEALRTLLRGMPIDLPAAVLVVNHTAATAPWVLGGLLNQATELTVAYAVDGEPIERGRVYLAPPNQHLLVTRGSVELSHGPRENHCRPAADPLFRSAARAYGNRVIGVVLTGTLDDGSRGLQVIKKLGGLAVVQDPDDSLFSGMPSSALQSVAVDHVVRLSEMAELLDKLTREALMEEQPTNDEGRSQDTPFRLTCPECGGSMQEIEDDGLLRFHCHVGHTYAAQALLEAQSREVEGAMWTALRILEDHAALRRKLAESARSRNHEGTAARFDQSADDAARHADIIRNVLLGK